MMLPVGSSQRSTDRQRGAQKREGMTETIAFIVFRVRRRKSPMNLPGRRINDVALSYVKLVGGTGLLLT